MFISLKDSTVISAGLCSEMLFSLGVAAALKNHLFGVPCIVTALLDGKHNSGSLHPLGKAADLRTLDLTIGQRLQWYEELAVLRPMGFDVVWEGGMGATPATTGAHIHIEYDPKGRQFWGLANAAKVT